MQIGLIGLGRMGGNIARRLIARGRHEVVVYDHNAKTVSELADSGATASSSLENLVKNLTAPRGSALLWRRMRKCSPS